ncbi:MAG: hypothetical protein E7628_02840 [Ruminococcaceae bacterium]|nr:hypothetical protein [Oscillospiraceae bacterium]
MAYDKIIDSAKLNSAMTATANAIRVKTGGTETIEWDESTGFASAVETIGGGSGNNGDDALKGLIEGSATELVNSTATTVRTYCFYSSKYTKIDLCVTKINSNAFANSKLNTLILRSGTVVTLSSLAAFNGITDSTWEEGDPLMGTLYVPSSLVNSYRSATNWSTLFNRGWELKSIEGSEYE